MGLGIGVATGSIINYFSNGRVSTGQTGNRIEKSDIDTIPCYENVHTREELIKKDKSTLSIGLVFGMVINIVLIVLGILLIIGKIHLPSNNDD